MTPEEIDLYEVFQVIWKRRKIVALTFLGVTLVAVLVSLIWPNVYQARAMVWVNFDWELFYWQKLAQASAVNFQNEKIFVVNVTDLRAARNRELNEFLVAALNGYPTLSKIKNHLESQFHKIPFSEPSINVALDKKYPQHLVLSAEARDPQMARVILEKVLQELEHHLIYYALNFCQENQVACEKSYRINFVQQPFVRADPVRPKRPLIVISGAISGLMLGLFLAFVWEGWVRRSQTV